MTGDSAMDMPALAVDCWLRILPALAVQLALDPECAGQKSVGRQNVADGGMRAATREVNICANDTEIAGRIGRSALQCTTTVGLRFVTRFANGGYQVAVRNPYMSGSGRPATVGELLNFRAGTEPVSALLGHMPQTGH